jgi:hypothetical protein
MELGDPVAVPSVEDELTHVGAGDDKDENRSPVYRGHDDLLGVLKLQFFDAVGTRPSPLVGIVQWKSDANAYGVVAEIPSRFVCAVDRSSIGRPL